MLLLVDNHGCLETSNGVESHHTSLANGGEVVIMIEQGTKKAGIGMIPCNVVYKVSIQDTFNFSL